MIIACIPFHIKYIVIYIVITKILMFLYIQGTSFKSSFCYCPGSYWEKS